MTRIHKDQAIERINDLIAELEGIVCTIEDEDYGAAREELGCQTGTIDTLFKQTADWEYE